MAFSLMGIIAVLFEFLRPVLLPLAVVLIMELLLIGLLFVNRQRLCVRPAVRLSAGIGVASGVLAALALPTMTGASIGQLSGILDFGAIIGAAIGIGAAVACLTYPPVQLAFRSPAPSFAGRPEALHGVGK